MSFSNTEEGEAGLQFQELPSLSTDIANYVCYGCAEIISHLQSSQHLEVNESQRNEEMTKLS